MNTCGGCLARWSGHTKAHCGSCHRTFSTVGNFDRHRSKDGERGSCLHPASVGLVERGGLDPVWSMPPQDPTKGRVDWWAAKRDGPADQDGPVNTVIQAEEETER